MPETIAEFAGLQGTEQPLNTSFDVALLDLDGVVYRGPDPIESAGVALAQARHVGMRSFYVTNNASRTPQMVAEHLGQLGIAAEPEQIINSAQAAAQLVVDEVGPKARVLPIGGVGLRDALTKAGLTVVSSADDRPGVVVQGFDKSLGWADLAEATYAIKAGARYIASNLDATIPTERGITLGNGALIAAVEHATGVSPLSAGKPEARIFQQAARRSGAINPLVVGDRLDTDLAGARAAQMRGLHVLTGVDGPQELLRARPQERPAYLGRDLGTMSNPQPTPVIHPDGDAQCRGARARITSDRVIIRRGDGDLDLGEGGRLTLDELRAACTAAWQASDHAQVDTVLSTPNGALTVSCD